MEINYEVLNKLLAGLLETDDVSLICKREISEFIESGDLRVFSDENLRQLSGIFTLSLKPAYEAITGKFIPNIFVRLENGDQIE